MVGYEDVCDCVVNLFNIYLVGEKQVRCKSSVISDQLSEVKSER